MNVRVQEVLDEHHYGRCHFAKFIRIALWASLWGDHAGEMDQ
jgi:hypothetical protein